MRDPLLHVGYHKTGSTWLQDAIFVDPKYGFVKQATNRVPIDDAFVAQNPYTFSASRVLQMSAFVEMFERAEATDAVPVISHERLSGDIGSGGVDSRMIADRLAETFPNGRVLICIREQIDMVLSVYKTEVRWNTYSIEERFRDRSVIERREPQPTLDYFQYHHLIAYYQKLFGKERVLVLPYEHLRADPLAFLAQVTRFVDLPDPADVPTEGANVSSPAAFLAFMRYVNMVLHWPGLRRFFVGPLEERLALRALLRVFDNVGPVIPEPISKRVDRKWRARIEDLAGDRYAESNRITSDLTGLDLASLGYKVG